MTINFNRNFDGNTVRKPSPGQLKFYYDLCEQRNVAPKDTSQMTFDEVSSLIQELRSHVPASEGQLNLIRQKIENLEKMGIPTKMPDESTLTGGRDGSASSLIEKLIKMEQENQHKAPPSEKQLDLIADMYLCPDVAYEDFNIPRKVELDVTNDKTGEKLWRKLTREEIKQSAMENMTSRDAYSFIEKHRGVYHTWKNSRAKISQRSYIRQLEERLSNMTKPQVIEWSTDQEGNWVQIPIKRPTTDITDFNGYQPLSDEDLMMFDENQASEYIDRLKTELENKELYKYGEQSDNSDTFEDLRTPSGINEVKAQDYQALQDLMYKLEAIAGYSDEELHGAVNYLLVEDTDDENTKKNKAKIREFMTNLINEDYISFEGLVEMCSDCIPAQRILLGQ